MSSRKNILASDQIRNNGELYYCHCYHILHSAVVTGSSLFKNMYIHETGRLKTNAKQCQDAPYSRLSFAGGSHLLARFADLLHLHSACLCKDPVGSQAAPQPGSHLATAMTPCLAPAMEDVHFQPFWARQGACTCFLQEQERGSVTFLNKTGRGHASEETKATIRYCMDTSGENALTSQSHGSQLCIIPA